MLNVPLSAVHLREWRSEGALVCGQPPSAPRDLRDKSQRRPPVTTLVAGLAKAHGERRLDEKLLPLAKPKLLIVDELGYLPLEPDAAHLFFQLVSRRYETGAMLITSNRSVAEWGTVFADPVVATAILDRLLHHSHVLTIRGDSYRLRAKRKRGLIKAQPAGDGPPVGSASLRPVTGGNNHQTTS